MAKQLLDVCHNTLAWLIFISLDGMPRTTKIGLCSIPWLPAFLAWFAFYAEHHPSYYAWGHMQLNPDGTTTITHGPPLPFQLPFDSALRAIFWASAIAFAIGLVLLLIGLGKSIMRKRMSAV
jgi:hypothetical protein